MQENRFLLNASMQDKIMSQKKHKCLHSMQECKHWMHWCKVRLWAKRGTNACIHCWNAGFLLNASMQDKIMSWKNHQCLHSMQECWFFYWMYLCTIRSWARRSTNACNQCRNAGVLLNVSMHDKIMSQKEHQCLHSVQECRGLIECIDTRQDYEREEALVLAFNAGMQGFYWMHRCKVRLWAKRGTNACIHCRNAGFLLNASMQDKIMSQKEHQCLH